MKYKTGFDNLGIYIFMYMYINKYKLSIFCNENENESLKFERARAVIDTVLYLMTSCFLATG